MNEASEPQAPEFDVRDLRNAFGMFATGVTVVTTCNSDGRPIGLTCNSFSSVSLKPPLVLWSLSLYSPNLQAFLQAPYFAVNILACDQFELSRRFSSRYAIASTAWAGRAEKAVCRCSRASQRTSSAATKRVTTPAIT
jgi:flavin reductase (DIM6/NTAB) family NADH-FMN oxidoreductase RutF